MKEPFLGLMIAWVHPDPQLLALCPLKDVSQGPEHLSHFAHEVARNGDGLAGRLTQQFIPVLPDHMANQVESVEVRIISKPDPLQQHRSPEEIYELLGKKERPSVKGVPDLLDDLLDMFA